MAPCDLMLSFSATTQIAADPTSVWATLVQTERWPAWDPSLDRVDGELTEDGRLSIHIEASSRPFKIEVIDWDQPRRLVFRSGLPLGLFTGTRTYDLRPSDQGTLFEMEERFSGPLAPLIGRTIPDLQPSFDAFVAGLRNEVESSQPRS